MNTPETINIEKYAEALNNLVGMDIGYLGDTDENVNAIVKVIRAAKALENRVQELEADDKKWQERFDREAKCQYDLAGKIVDLKSKVDLYKRLNDELEDELASTYDKLENAKADVAEEIFAEIESKLKSVYAKWIVNNFFELDGYELDCVEAMFGIDLNFAELKKKYTEEEG